MTERTRNLTERQAMATYRKFVRYFRVYDITVAPPVLNQGDPWPSDGPALVRNYGPWHGGSPRWAIVWEGGPYEWPHLFPDGGIDEEFGFHWPEVKLPKGVWTEPINGYSLALYPDDGW